MLAFHYLLLTIEKRKNMFKLKKKKIPKYTVQMSQVLTHLAKIFKVKAEKLNAVAVWSSLPILSAYLSLTWWMPSHSRIYSPLSLSQKTSEIIFKNSVVETWWPNAYWSCGKIHSSSDLKDHSAVQPTKTGSQNTRGEINRGKVRKIVSQSEEKKQSSSNSSLKLQQTYKATARCQTCWNNFWR